MALLLVKLFRLADTQPGGACGRQATLEEQLWWQFRATVECCLRTIQRKSSCIADSLMLFSQVCNEASEQGSRPHVAPSFDFLMQLCSIATPLLPSLEQVGLVGIKQAPSIRRPTPFGKGLSSDEATNGFPTHLESPRDVTQTPALLVKRTHSFIAAIPIGTAHL